MTASVSPVPSPAPRAFLCELRDIGVLTVTGADAAEFLQGQLSSDVNALAPGQAQYSSYNSAKGRMLATLVVVSGGPDGIRLLLAGDLAEPVRKRLAMFVLRSKATVANLTGDGVTLGVGGIDALAAVASVFGQAPAGFGEVERDGATALALPDGRFIVSVSAARAATMRDTLAAHAPVADLSLWRWLGIRAGVPVVTLATSDQFVAQTANWDLLGGINFRKGCYPGQEIVARMQYLGRLKERLHAFHADAPPPAEGTKLYAAAFGDQSCGTVVNAAPSPAGGSDLLAVVQIAAAEAGGLHLGASDGAALQPLPLPYAIPPPVAPRGRIA